MKFIIPGEPQGKARARTVKTKKGKTVSFTPEKTELYENLIKQIAMQSKIYFEGPVKMNIIAFYGVPASDSKKKRIEKLANIIRPTKKPDLDNVCKVICDALNGVVYKDDTQVVSITIGKYYSEKPCVEVSVEEV